MGVDLVISRLVIGRLVIGGFVRWATKVAATHGEIGLRRLGMGIFL